MKGSRTIIFNVIMALLMVGKQFGLDVDLDESAVNQGLDAFDKIWMAVTVLGNGVFRFFTDTKIFKKE